MISPELQMKIAGWKDKIRNKTITVEEMKEAITFLRSDRKMQSEGAKSKPGASKKAAPVDSNALLNQLKL